jgi:hypothetical protein
MWNIVVSVRVRAFGVKIAGLELRLAGLLFILFIIYYV